MGTRSLTIIKDSADVEICVIYRQFDGYLEGGHGQDLAEFLADMRIVNGYQMEDKTGEAANGMSCLAAQIVRKLKDGIGGIYIYAAGTRDTGEDYTYTLSEGALLPDKRSHSVNVKVESDGEVLFNGPARDLIAHIEKLKLENAED